MKVMLVQIGLVKFWQQYLYIVTYGKNSDTPHKLIVLLNIPPDDVTSKHIGGRKYVYPYNMPCDQTYISYFRILVAKRTRSTRVWHGISRIIQSSDQI